MRLETGAVQCGDDWPGIFIRGDDALGYSISLHNILAVADTGAVPRHLLARLHGLERLLGSCDARMNPQTQMVKISKEPPQPDVPWTDK